MVYYKMFRKKDKTINDENGFILHTFFFHCQIPLEILVHIHFAGYDPFKRCYKLEANTRCTKHTYVKIAQIVKYPEYTIINLSCIRLSNK